MCISRERIKITSIDHLGEPEKINIDVPCGRCYQCNNSKRTAWTFRMIEHMKDFPLAHFVTLTYNDENLVYGKNGPTLYYRDFQLYIKRLRKSITLPVSYFACGEYSPEQRPHYHAIIFNAERKKIHDAWNGNGRNKGHVHIGQATNASIHYCTKYIVNPERKPDGKEPEKALVSKGIGMGYIKRVGTYHHENLNYYTYLNGHKIPLPRYFKKKLLTLDQRVQEMDNYEEMEVDEIEKIKKQLYRQHLYDKYSSKSKKV